MAEEVPNEEVPNEEIPSEVPTKPEFCDDRFWDAEKNEINVESLHKSWLHANDKISGKKQAPEAYELQFSEDFNEELLTGVTSENPLVAQMMDVAKESDMSQENFNKLMNAMISSEIEDIRAVEEYKEQEMAQLGEHGKRRIKDLELWLDASLDKEDSAALKGVMNTSRAVEALEKLRSSMKTPSLVVDNELTDDQKLTHDELRDRQFAKDEHGNRKMQNPAYAKKWREDAAAANFRSQ